MASQFASIRFEAFFDRQGIVAAMDKKERRVLSSTGAFSRTVMRRGMRRVKASAPPSLPGEYPHAITGLLRDRIFFAYDQAQGGVVVGPELLSVGRYTLIGAETVPDVLNRGGTVIQTRRYRPRKNGFIPPPKTIRSQIAPRPLVSLTLPAAAEKLAQNMETIPL